eukprot:TRINITY_DN9404_c0_g1_i1.p1 TRINITY_DN9404_c0_g1~~TRINITY_DN9404_c0_g1_i1.p1  ORF type:complete len:341 (-),score=48.10 TRINITY_DN9404_c0_g1_i1:74-1096(-)
MDLNGHCGNLTSCHHGICVDEKCFCDGSTYLGGIDCSKSLSEEIGLPLFLLFHITFLILYFLVCVVSGTLLVTMIRFPKIPILSLHKVGIGLINAATICRVIFLIAALIDENLPFWLTHLDQILYPTILSIFLFQIVIWMEVTRTVKILPIPLPSPKITLVVCVVYAMSVYLIQMSYATLIILRTHNYSIFYFVWNSILGGSTVLFALTFWVMHYIAAAIIKKSNVFQAIEADERSHRTVTICAIIMTALTLMTLLTGALTTVFDSKKNPDFWFPIRFPLRLAETGYCIVFLMSLGLPTYRVVWRCWKASDEDEEASSSSSSSGKSWMHIEMTPDENHSG